MLQKIKNELRMAIMYNVIFMLVVTIDSNNGIDEYYLGELVKNIFGEAGLWLLGITVLYLIAAYIVTRLSKVIKADMTELKTELNRKEMKA